MEYAQAVAYLYDRLPVFHRIGAKALKPGLGNTEALCAALGNPERRFRSIHVAGTNGKGSTSHMLASVYQAAGYRVGLYTSPHLKSFTERIRINGQPIPDGDVAQFVTDNQLLIESIEPSFFEVTVAMAFAHFARETVDLAIIEVGLGGRLDSTNVITPLLSVITNIGWDHVDLLGDTLPLIAAEKAGIIKPGVPVVIGETQPETTDVFMTMARAGCSPIQFADTMYGVTDKGIRSGRREVAVQSPGSTADEVYSLDLVGGYQLKNLLSVLATAAQLQLILPVSDNALRIGLSTVMVSTGLKGRFQTLREHPLVIADTAHNQPGIAALLASVLQLPYAQLHIVMGFVQDKDVTAVLRLLPTDALYYLCTFQSMRAMPVEMLHQAAIETGLIAKHHLPRLFPDVNQGLVIALSVAGPNDLIVVTGSTYLVAELTSL